MNNRFGPDVTRFTKTPCVTLLDDDVLLSVGLIRAMIDAWEGGGIDNPASSEEDTRLHPIVGVDGDQRTMDSKRGYLYPCDRWEGWIVQGLCWNPFISRTPNLVIGKTMTFSTRHLKEYQNDKDVWYYTSPDGGHYCEDIVMNALVWNTTKLDPVFVRNDKKYLSKYMGTRGGTAEKGGYGNKQDDRKSQTRYILDEAGGLSFKGFTPWGLYESSKWNLKRSDCVKWAAVHYTRE